MIENYFPFYKNLVKVLQIWSIRQVGSLINDYSDLRAVLYKVAPRSLTKIYVSCRSYQNWFFGYNDQ